MENILINDKHFKRYLSSEDIALTVSRMAAEISRDYRESRPLFIAVLNGSFIFAADLLRKLDFNCELSFVKMASYENTQSSGNVKQLIGLKEDVSKRQIVILEDIVETGKTMAAVRTSLAMQHPASLRIASLFVKPQLFCEDFSVDYQGFEIPDHFIVGYGLDYNGHGRNLPDIYQIV